MKQVIYLKENANLKQVTILDCVIHLSIPFVNVIANLCKGIKEMLKITTHTFFFYPMCHQSIKLHSTLTFLYITGRQKGGKKREKI